MREILQVIYTCKRSCKSSHKHKSQPFSRLWCGLMPASKANRKANARPSAESDSVPCVVCVRVVPSIVLPFTSPQLHLRRNLHPSIIRFRLWDSCLFCIYWERNVFFKTFFSLSRLLYFNIYPNVFKLLWSCIEKCVFAPAYMPTTSIRFVFINILVDAVSCLRVWLLIIFHKWQCCVHQSMLINFGMEVSFTSDASTEC